MRFSAMFSNFSPLPRVFNISVKNVPPFQVNFICRTFCIRSFQLPLSSPYKNVEDFLSISFSFAVPNLGFFLQDLLVFQQKITFKKKKQSFSSLLIHLLFSSFFRFFMFPRLCRCFRGRFGRPAWSRGTTTLV